MYGDIRETNANYHEFAANIHDLGSTFLNNKTMIGSEIWTVCKWYVYAFTAPYGKWNKTYVHTPVRYLPDSPINRTVTVAILYRETDTLYRKTCGWLDLIKFLPRDPIVLEPRRTVMNFDVNGYDTRSDNNMNGFFTKG